MHSKPGHIYAVGGDGGDHSYVERYSAKTDSWEDVASLNTGRFHAGCGVVGGKLYAFGGFGDAYEELRSMEVYDPATNTWSECPPMKHPRSVMGYGAINNKIYVCGGESDDILKGGEVFDVATQTWSESMPDMITGVRWCGSAVALHY